MSYGQVITDLFELREPFGGVGINGLSSHTGILYDDDKFPALQGYQGVGTPSDGQGCAILPKIVQPLPEVHQ